MRKNKTCDDFAGEPSRTANEEIGIVQFQMKEDGRVPGQSEWPISTLTEGCGRIGMDDSILKIVDRAKYLSCDLNADEVDSRA